MLKQEPLSLETLFSEEYLIAPILNDESDETSDESVPGHPQNLDSNEEAPPTYSCRSNNVNFTNNTITTDIKFPINNITELIDTNKK